MNVKRVVHEFAKRLREATDPELKRLADSWVENRLGEEEPLMFNDFVTLMVDMNEYKRADVMALKLEMIKAYNDGKARMKANPIKSNRAGAW